MGGCTITKVGDNIEDLLGAMEKQILAAMRSGLWVDSVLCVINPEEKKARLFKVEYEETPTIPVSYPKGVIFLEVEKGPAFHVGIAGRYGPKPEKGQIVATVHVSS